MSDEANAEARAYLRHALATLAYRGGKVLRGAPPGFVAFEEGESSRTPLQILAHVADLCEWARSLARGEEAWRESSPATWDDAVQSLFGTLSAHDVALAEAEPLRCPVNSLSFTCSSAEFSDGIGTISGSIYGCSAQVAMFGFSLPVSGNKITFNALRLFAQPGATKIK